MPELTINEILSQLSPEGHLHWENAVLKAQLTQIQAEKLEDVGQSDE
tara:strand:- start:3623 stop:3763 length:141 start_codon:yes stop_codon:yes gene_type:complete